MPLTIVPMKTTSSLQIRPIQALKPDPPEVPPKPTQTYTCSFCNGKQSSQENLLQHLNQHVNFGGALPSKSGKLFSIYTIFYMQYVISIMYLDSFMKHQLI